MRGASVSIMVKEANNDAVVFSYDADREVIPASVIKTVTTATAIELLKENFRYETAIMYDGEIQNNTLKGNLYIRGSGDPTLGSGNIGADRDKTIRKWVNAVKDAGICKITGSIISDESIFDTEGPSMKWLREDLGSYYGQGCYGLNVYDNRYSLFLKTGKPNSKPEIQRSDPGMLSIFFHNYLKTAEVKKDSTYIVGFPFSNERYLYGVVPAKRLSYKLTGDIPDPALFLAQYMKQKLEKEGIVVAGEFTCYRILSQENKWKRKERKILTTTYSLPLKDLIGITNHVSSNLYADALLKTIGLRYRTEAAVSSFSKGVVVLNNYWKKKGIETAPLWMFDGSGLAPTNKVTAKFLCEILSYMATQSKYSKTFIESIPKAGVEGTVQNTLRGSFLHGKARLKSGSMSRVRSYAGYITKENKQYVMAVLVNNFSCKQSRIKTDIEQLILSLFTTNEH